MKRKKVKATTIKINRIINIISTKPYKKPKNRNKFVAASSSK